MDLIKPEDPRLWEVAKRVDDIATQVLPILSDVRIAMAKAPFSVALSAPQVGVGLRFFITSGKLLASVVINPVIWERSEETVEDKEGCLSWPGQWAMVRRPQWIKVSFLNIKGEVREQKLTGHAARIFLHEFDHLEGICIFPRPAPTEPEPVEAPK
jgi:peptide deformylase